MVGRFSRRAVVPVGCLVACVVMTAGFFAVHGVASGWVPVRAAAGGVPAGQAASLYLFAYYLGPRSSAACRVTPGPWTPSLANAADRAVTPRGAEGASVTVREIIREGNRIADRHEVTFAKRDGTTSQIEVCSHDTALGPTSSAVPDSPIGRYPAAFQAVDNLPGKPLVRDADDGLGFKIPTGGVGEAH